MDFNEIFSKIKDALGNIDFGEIWDKIEPYLSKIGDFLKKTPSFFAAFILFLTVIIDPAAGSTESSTLVSEETKVLMDAYYMGQGLTNDGTYYYTSGAITALKMTALAKYNMKTMERVDLNKKPLPDVLKKRGNDHIGGISYYNGKIYAAVEDSKAYQYPCIVVFDAATLDYVTYYDVNPGRFPDGIPWLAVDSGTGMLYASAWSNASVIQQFQISAVMAHVKEIELQGLGVLDRIQGGEFYNGKLYLSADNQDSGKIKNVYSVDVNTGVVKLAFTRDVGKADVEAEDMTACLTDNGAVFHVLDYNKLLGVFDVNPDLIGKDALANPKSLNVALAGALSVFLEIPETAWLDAVRANLPERLHEVNFKAFEAGRAAGRAQKGSTN